jgi:aryl-alcohol dehydrogenase-like predicted oxidoreductase
MTDVDLRKHVTLGRTGLRVSRIGLASGYKVPTRAVERAFAEHGINFFNWDRRKPGMRDALRSIAREHRDEVVIAIESYDHSGLFVRRSVHGALRDLGIDRADILLLGWFNSMPSRRILDLTARLREEGKIRFLGVTGHDRAFHGRAARSPGSPIDVHQVRYSAAHRGAETDVFEGLPADGPGIVTYTATRWGRLLEARRMPAGVGPMTAAECYRFVLTHPAVHVCLAGPRTEQEMVEGLEALSQGPLDDEEMARARRIGDHVHG